MFGDVAATIHKWRTWSLMANQDIHMRYRRSVLGPFWISISMAALILGVALLYSQVLKAPFQDYLHYLACGIVVWNFMSGLLIEGCLVVVESEGHLRSVRIPIPVLAARVVYRNFIIFLHNVLVVGLMILAFGWALSPIAAAAAAGVAVYLLIGYFAAILLGPLCARFRDVAQVIVNVMQIAFFLSPVIWGMGRDDVRSIVKEANPFFHLLEIIRAPMLGDWPAALNWLISACILVTVFVAALSTLTFTRRRTYLWL
jgi:lipopolysaccharide transport system permease protein